MLAVTSARVIVAVATRASRPVSVVVFDFGPFSSVLYRSPLLLALLYYGSRPLPFRSLRRHRLHISIVGSSAFPCIPYSSGFNGTFGLAPSALALLHVFGDLGSVLSQV